MKLGGHDQARKMLFFYEKNESTHSLVFSSSVLQASYAGVVRNITLTTTSTSSPVSLSPPGGNPSHVQAQQPDIGTFWQPVVSSSIPSSSCCGGVSALARRASSLNCFVASRRLVGWQSDTAHQYHNAANQPTDLLLAVLLTADRLFGRQR